MRPKQSSPREGRAPARPLHGDDQSLTPDRLDRTTPNHGILWPPSGSAIIFITACTKDRKPWLATPKCHALLKSVWQSADLWCVGRYVLMPDHVHFFASPNGEAIELENWMQFWKSQFTKHHGVFGHYWQRSHWDTRLRRNQSYNAKWEYVRDNPVRAGLVKSADDWPYQGELYDLPWH